MPLACNAAHSWALVRDLVTGCGTGGDFSLVGLVASGYPAAAVHLNPCGSYITRLALGSMTGHQPPESCLEISSTQFHPAR